MPTRVPNSLTGQVPKRRPTGQSGKEVGTGPDLTEIFSPVKAGPVKDCQWSNMGSLQASVSWLKLVADWP